MAAGDIVVVNENSFAKQGNYFDGTDDYVLHDAHAVARVAANDTVGTYTAWIYLDSLIGTKTILSAGDNNAATEFVEFKLNSSGKLGIKLFHASAVQFIVEQTAVTLKGKTWHHVAIVQNGVQPVLYIDGLAVAITNTTATDLTFWYDELTGCDKFAIGVLESNATHTQDFKGAIGRVKYFARAMSADEIMDDITGTTNSNTETAAAIETARVFDISMIDDGTTDSGSGADNGTLTGNAHYGGYISTYSQAMENNVTGHAAEDMNSVVVADRIQTIIKRGD